MRIAIVSPYALDVVGGVQSHVRSLARALRAAGDEVLVLGPTAVAPAGRAAAAVGDARPSPEPTQPHVGRTTAVPANGSRAPVALGPGAAVRLRSLLRRAAPDVVHVHEPLVPVIGPAAVLGTTAASVLTFHATAEGGALPVLYRAVRAPARRIVARGDVLTAVSPVAAAFHARMLGIDVASLTIVPNGVDVARFASSSGSPASPTGTAPSGPLLVFLGRLEHRKGADVVVRAFLELAPRRRDLRLRILGDGPLAPLLRSLVADAPEEVSRRIELAGRVEPEHLPALLAEGDVALLPARGGESFGIVLLEAMAAGLPVVATDIPGYRAVARPDREALLVAPDDPTALAVAVARVLDDQALAARLRAAGRARAEEHDWTHVARTMQDVYALALERAARGAPPR
jgi:phosphatidylinositol alpha-mannosyltransferase